ncbi:hypothetical protein QJS10_CPB20g00953 [Acorus calamus]|uniref:Uncharacterized protein n=1 Tax=Acorus calamus TaxID=4465 RepID=A0AAV9CDA3_ACOCL|nr:hypothetical protein QJS10_CPB20g00953 [Acorus calamus]
MADYAKILKDKRFWFVSFLITWPVVLQGHMKWMQMQESFKQKFEDLQQKEDGDD